MGVFDTIVGAIDQQFSTGENKLHSLDTMQNGSPVIDGRLGEFANKFDQSAQREWLAEGFAHNSIANFTPKQMEIWMNEPDCTVLVKKRALSSLAENYRTDLMSKEEQTFLRATKVLFQNKCQQISAYEKLTKIASIVTDIGQLDHQLLPVIFSATEALDDVSSLFGSSAFSKFKSVLDRVKTIVNLSQPNIYTTWTTNVLSAVRSNLGEGTGVIEFTTNFSLNTTTSIHFGAGSFDLNFTDPYNLMTITHNDIEKAIADATNAVFGNSIVQLSLDTLNKNLKSDKEKLNKIRAKRGANPINFLVNPDTFLGKRVRAIIDGSGLEIQFEGSIFKVSIDSGYLYPGVSNSSGSVFSLDTKPASKQPAASAEGAPIAGTDGLSASESSLFSSIIRSTYNQMQINANSRNQVKSNNNANNSLRKKMRLHYGGKCIIQPMDSVHIFIGSKKAVDTKILGGLQDNFNAIGTLQSINKAFSSIEDFLSAGKNGSIEKELYVGSDFPNWLWLIMRNQFTSDKSGTQVFAGIVEKSASSFDSQSGTFNVSVNGKDNSAYFNFGVINYKPALDVWNGSLYDPITPFDIKFDRATGFQPDGVPQLLQENQDLFKSAFVKYKNGVYVGKKPTIDNFVQDTERVQNASIRRVFYDPDGMVYKWKEGIGTLVMFGNNYSGSQASNTSIPPLTDDPFAGQDIMNVLSLLITGEPYNFATFYKAARDFNGSGRDPATGQDPSVSYFKNLQTDIKKRNLLYGNFIPYKRLSMDTETYKSILNNQSRAQGFDAELNQLVQEKAELNDRITFLKPLGDDGLSPETSDLQIKVSALDQKISDKTAQINDELNKINKPISIIGDDITLDYDPNSDNTDKNALSQTDSSNKRLQRKTHYLTRRLSWKVRANEDLNYLIVDDTYDKDIDIQAFEKSFTNQMSQFKSDYQTVANQIERVSKLFDLEVFANTQGHIEIRPPKYNKMPSSVFFKMIKLKDEFNIQLFPQFIEDLYVNQIENTISQIEVLEDEIRMYGLALSKSSDADMDRFLNQTVTFGRGSSPSGFFAFLSDESTGAIPRVQFELAQLSTDPTTALNNFSNGLNALDSIQTQATINDILSTASRPDALKALTAAPTTVSATLSDPQVKQKQNIIAARLQQKTGQLFDLSQLFPNSAKLVGATTLSQVDLLKIMNEITSRIQQRQKTVKIAASALKNAKESLSLLKIQNSDSLVTSALMPGLTDNFKIPQGFDALIEDESYDDYGPGSGKRFVIKNAFIKSFAISEAAPPFTAVEVEGRFGDNFAVGLDPTLNGFQGGGNALTTATAIDYDMWRMYGIRLPQSVSTPYLSDPTTQAAPFAVSLLNQARKQIHTGSIVIFGNEFMQPGEVVYLEDKDMLYYVESVSHSFAFGRTFNTTLNVSYGHMPGEYIPTYLDTAGKILYKNKDITSYVHRKQDNVSPEEHLGTIATSLNGDGSIDSIMTSIFGNENRQVLLNVLNSATSVFSGADGSYQPHLEIRVFFASKSGYPGSTDSAQNAASNIKDYLLGRNNMSELVKTTQPASFLANNEQFIQVVPVDTDDPEEFRSPSSHAFSMARQILNKKPGSTNGTTNLIDNIIWLNIVDCWIYFKKTAT